MCGCWLVTILLMTIQHPNLAYHIHEKPTLDGNHSCTIEGFG